MAGAIVALLAVALAFATGCGSRNRRPLNVLLITLDAQRADHLGCYGYHRETSPNIDALAARGVLFRQANANAPWTLPSFASILTSQFPMDHGATTPRRALPGSNWLLPKIMQRHGYFTAAAIASGFVAPHYNIAQGFNRFVGDRFKDETTAHFRCMDSPPWVTDFGLKFLKVHRDQPFFLWLHYLKPHDPYLWQPKHRFLDAPPTDLPEYLSLPWLTSHQDELTPKQMHEIVALYDGQTAYADSYIGQILGQLDRLGLRERTVVVLSSDHGEQFLQHGAFGHHRQIYQDELHVPLIIAAPTSVKGGRSVDEPVQLVDLMPTLLDLCGIREQVSGARGQSLMPLLTGRSGYREQDIVASVSEPDQSEDVELMRSIRRGDWKLLLKVRESKTELYDLAADPGEQHNLAGRGLDVERQLRNALSRYRRARSRPGLKLSPETERRLRGVGYLR
ncbi:MAG: sulfatase [Armatimonadota bacterium]|nr:MAG: sulfatase [Armatimonadota bacterium]